MFYSSFFHSSIAKFGPNSFKETSTDFDIKLNVKNFNQNSQKNKISHKIGKFGSPLVPPYEKLKFAILQKVFVNK